MRADWDPFEEHNDAEVLCALALVFLDSYVNRLFEGLNTPLDSSNAALSSGMKQFLCMARVIFANNRILATANVNLDTDVLIQATLRTNFNSQAITTVAHLIDTIRLCYCGGYARGSSGGDRQSWGIEKGKWAVRSNGESAE